MKKPHQSIFSDKRLKENLDVLAQVDPIMAQRLSWPVDNLHIRIKKTNTSEEIAQILYRDTWQDLEPINLASSSQSIADEISAFANKKKGSNILLFGIGIGGYAEALLTFLPVNSIIHIFDQDPWMLRLFLMRLDIRKELSTGRCRIYLGTDLVRLRQHRESLHIFWHPVLKKIYHNERAFFMEKDFSNKELAILIGEGTLFVDDVADVLRKMGHDVFPWFPVRISIEEAAYQIVSFRPNAVFNINYLHGLAPFVVRHGSKFICWEIDPIVDRLDKGNIPTQEDIFIFTYNPNYVKTYLAAGFKQVEYLPLASNTSRRRPTELTPDLYKKYKTPVSFVGASMKTQAEELKSLFLKIPSHYFNGKDAHTVFQKIVETQLHDMDTYRVPEILSSYLSPGQKPIFSFKGSTYEIPMLIAETLAMHHRLQTVTRLGTYGIDVWGDRGWKDIVDRGVHYRGPAGHTQEINYIYKASDVNVDINRIFQKQIVTMRVFDVLACEGFIIAEHNKSLKELFDIDREVVSYRNNEELDYKVGYFLSHPEERHKIAMAGRKAVEQRHDIKHRITYILREAGLGQF